MPARPQVTALVGVLALVAVSVLAATAIAATARVADEARRTARDAAELARFDALLVRAAARITYPRDEPQPAWRQAGGAVEIDFLDGDRSRTLSIAPLPSGGVEVRVAEARHRVRGLSLVVASTTRDPVPAVRVSVRLGARTVVLEAPLGGVTTRSRRGPLGAERSER